MRVWFDTNASVAEGCYSLGCVGTRRDLSALGIEPAAGMRFTLYMEDEGPEGVPELLLVDAVVEDLGGELVAHVDPTTSRLEPAPLDAV